MRKATLFLSLLVLLSLNETNLIAQTEPTLFAEGVINTDADQYGPTFTRDGATLYFTERQVRDQQESIMMSRRSGGVWSKPVITSFSGSGFDKEPYLSPDGSKLFFASKRPVGGEDHDFDIWMVVKTA